MVQPIDIQIERSLVNTPTTLLYGEPAWDDANETLYIGNSSGVPVAVGGNSPAQNKKSWGFGGAINSGNVKASLDFSYLAGLTYSASPIIVPTDCFIFFIASHNNNNDRGYEAHVLDDDVSVANLSMPIGTNTSSSSYNVFVQANSEIRLRFVETGSGNNSVAQPNMYVYFIEA